MSDGAQIVAGIGWIALVGGGFRALILLWALRTGNAQPPERARVAAKVFAAIAALGALTLLAVYLSS